MPEDGPVAPAWLEWARALQSIAQAGLTYARDEYDLERYREIRRIAAGIASTGSGQDQERIEDFFASGIGYPTPKIDVRAAVIVEGRILLVRERDDGLWSMPGGWADVGESAAESVVRETREEAGLEVRAVKLIALYERERHGHPLHPEFSYKAFFACEPLAEDALAQLGAEPAASGYETLDAGFFKPDKLPPLSLARITPEEVTLAFEHARAPHVPTAFD
jgi:ADP-ribose pyrophosphatase YjhB (NUDIX family)